MHPRGGRAGRVVPDDDDARRLGAAARDPLEQPHAKLCDLALAENLHREAEAAAFREIFNLWTWQSRPDSREVIEHRLEVYDRMTVEPDDTWVTYPVEGRTVVSLQTCVPIPTFENRLIVRARPRSSPTGSESH